MLKYQLQCTSLPSDRWPGSERWKGKG